MAFAGQTRSTLGVYFERRLLVGAYFDRTVQFVPNGSDWAENIHNKHYVDNCIAFTDQFLFGREAKEYLTANSLDTEFDVKDLLARDRVDGDQLKRYPFEWCFDSPPKVHLKPPALNGQNNCMIVETLVALQVLDIKHRAETAMKTPAQRAVFCVPTRYNTKQRRAMLDVGLIAGFDGNNVHIVNEMTAAVIAYVMDTRRKLIFSEIVIIFAIHDNHCECGLIEVDNNCIKHLSYGVVDDVNGFTHFIDRTLWLRRVDKRDLSRVVVIGHSDKIFDFKEVIKAEIAADFATKQNILYACDPIDVIVKGAVYYGQMLDKKLDTIDVREIIRADIKLLIQKNNDKPFVETLIPMNPNPNQYEQLNEIKVIINRKSFPIKLCQMEGDTVVKTLMVNDKPSKYFKFAESVNPLTRLIVRYRMDRDSLGVCLNATLKTTYGSESDVDLDKVDEYGLSYQCITGQRSILRELGVFSAPNISVNNWHQSVTARVQSVGSASLTPGPSRVASVPNAISAPPMAAAVAADAVQEFSQLCADIRVRLETCGAIATKRRKIAEKLLDCEKCFKTDAKKLEEQKQQLFRLIDGYNLRDKLITN
ncbi:unnamed protein product [Medioppia subpectinata]|uniref:Uncharacterized protein n=1 Tax=Medioppia subpectinata TaxID=1979941 RepID=A0A7R9PUM7_9ACAR|nr:unnamed protein product [Medioppia subpectinata]CAG2101385.1 unnamed protein product [Medioppia subpectinata]